jgi:hypothetical protein
VCTGIAEAVPSLSKELIAIVAEYARPFGVRTIVGTPKVAGFVDGHALREAKFEWPSGVAIDDTDPVAGPQLIISDWGDNAIRCLNLRSEHTIAGDSRCVGDHRDGPARAALFNSPIGLSPPPASCLSLSRSDSNFLADAQTVSPLPHQSLNLWRVVLCVMLRFDTLRCDSMRCDAMRVRRVVAEVEKALAVAGV